ncbi:Uncharacterised protein [Mycobacteroides abscessus]|nr:Uncharacterised protein [Mycobacteroides abscessus]
MRCTPTSGPSNGLSHSGSGSGATVRISPTWSSGVTRGPRSRIAANASWARARGTRYSDCSSAPLLGVKSSRKCGSRSFHGPGSPSCGVQCTGSMPGRGCSIVVAGVAPKSSARAAPASPGVRRDLRQTCWTPSGPQSVKRLTEYADAVISS